jgi:hypothetical protein
MHADGVGALWSHAKPALPSVNGGLAVEDNLGNNTQHKDSSLVEGFNIT